MNYFGAMIVKVQFIRKKIARKAMEINFYRLKNILYEIIKYILCNIMK